MKTNFDFKVYKDCEKYIAETVKKFSEQMIDYKQNSKYQFNKKQDDNQKDIISSFNLDALVGVAEKLGEFKQYFKFGFLMKNEKGLEHLETLGKQKPNLLKAIDFINPHWSMFKDSGITNRIMSFAKPLNLWVANSTNIEAINKLFKEERLQGVCPQIASFIVDDEANGNLDWSEELPDDDVILKNL